MATIQRAYARDLDLNLLRVFAVVADEGSVTRAAGRLYLTQPAVSAALRRLERAVGMPLFARQGRGLALTARGQALISRVRAPLDALVDAALSPEAFDPMKTERTIRIGVSDAAEIWLLPPLLRWLEGAAPRTTLIVSPVQFRTVGEALSTRRVDMAVTVADDVPAGTLRRPILVGGFVGLYDPRRLRLPARLDLKRYLAQEHVIVSYNGDLRGIVEDLLGLRRRVRCSVASFQAVGAIVEGTTMMATVPEMVARSLIRTHPQLRATKLPFPRARAPMELLWRAAMDDDAAHRFVRDGIVRLAQDLGGPSHRPPAR